MAVDRASGTENLRANETIKSGSVTDSPSGGGKDCGGVENKRADQTVKSAAGNSTPSGSKDLRPSGVQSFNGESA
jgi:hypothetical protein